MAALTSGWGRAAQNINHDSRQRQQFRYRDGEPQAEVSDKRRQQNKCGYDDDEAPEEHEQFYEQSRNVHPPKVKRISFHSDKQRL